MVCCFTCIISTLVCILSGIVAVQSIEYISHSITAGFNVCVAYILLNISKFSHWRDFPMILNERTCIPCPHQHLSLKTSFYFCPSNRWNRTGLLVFSMFVLCLLAVLDSFFWSCLFMSCLHLSQTFLKLIFIGV